MFLFIPLGDSLVSMFWFLGGLLCPSSFWRSLHFVIPHSSLPASTKGQLLVEGASRLTYTMVMI